MIKTDIKKKYRTTQRVKQQNTKFLQSKNFGGQEDKEY